MRLLTATTATQGERDGDFSWTVEGELIKLDEPCATDARDPGGGCGCGRAFSGMSSHRASTTAMVRDLPLSRADVAIALAGYYESAGYGTFTAAELAPEIADLVSLGRFFRIGTVVERRLEFVQVRHPIGRL